MIGTWTCRIAIVALLMSLHWLAHRIRRRRERALLFREAGGRDVTASQERRISNEPIEPV